MIENKVKKDLVVDENEKKILESNDNDELYKCMKSSTLDKIACFLAEFIGTALLVFLGCMGCINFTYGNVHHLVAVLNFGLTVMFIVQIFGCVSGSHLNPAVTAAAFVYKLVTWQMALVYFVAQMLGAFVGYGLLKVIVPYLHRGEGFCVTKPTNGVNVFQALAIEFIITSVLVLVCCGVWDPRNKNYHDSVSIRFGLTITALACAGGPFTGGSMNPARSFAPALWNTDFTDHWVYWVGPLAAGFLTSILYRLVFYRNVPEEKIRNTEEFPLSSHQKNNV